MKQERTNTPQNKPLEANKGKSLEIKVGGQTYLRLPIKTHIITPKDRLIDLVERYVVPHLLPDDIIFISEKIVCVVQGRFMNMNDVKPSRLARFLSRKVQNKYGTKDFRGFGHGTPMGMQLLIEEAGYPRVFFAAVVSALTRPLGIKGAFYWLVGKKAKSVDCPMSFLILEYAHCAKLAPLNPKGVAKEIKEKFGHETIILDANYRGAFSLGKSTRKIKEKFIYELFRDNPLGQSDEMTPFCIVRRK